MSKIIVDEMPEKPCYCPFSYMGDYVHSSPGVNPHYKYMCVLNKDGFCDLYEGNYCCHLTELPKEGKRG